MTKKQTRGAVDALQLDASKQGASLADMWILEDTPASALIAAKAGGTVRKLLRTINSNVSIWSQSNINRVSSKAGLVLSIPAMFSESISTALVEAALKPLGKATGLKVVPPKEKDLDADADADADADSHADADSDADADSHADADSDADGLTEAEIADLLAEIECEEAEDAEAPEDEEIIE